MITAGRGGRGPSRELCCISKAYPVGGFIIRDAEELWRQEEGQECWRGHRL